MGISTNPIEGEDLISSAYNMSDIDPANNTLLPPVSTGEGNTLPMDLEQELNEFLEQDPLLKACESSNDVKAVVEANVTA